MNILKRDSKFLIKYVKEIYSDKQFSLSADHRKLGFIWLVENIETELKDVIHFIVSKEPYFGILDHFCNTFFRNIDEVSKVRAENFLINYAKQNHKDPDKMNVVIDIVRNSVKYLFEKILLQHLKLNTNVEIFRKIWWRGNGGTYTGDIIIGDIEASEWRDILSIIEKSDVGLELIPIKIFVNERIESNLRSGDRERQRRFLERD